MKIRAPKGMPDRLPPESEELSFVLAEATRIAILYGYSEIMTPILEHEELFRKGVGEASDIVAHEMFSFDDKGGDRLCLRPENTAGIVRAFIEHSLEKRRFPLRLFYRGPMFRRERPQSGRYRQFTQFGVELFGAEEPMADFEVISMAADIAQACRVAEIRLLINSVGCEDCRPLYVERLRAFIDKHSEQMCQDCKRRRAFNPLRSLDCKNLNCRDIMISGPKMDDFLCDGCKLHFTGLTELLDHAGIGYEVSSRLVRGLDYYTGTVFEFTSESLGSQDAFCGGGRYDYLVEKLGGKRTCGIGFSVGVERIALAGELKTRSGVDVYLAYLGEEAKRVALKLARMLRESGISVECEIMNRNMKPQLKAAGKSGAKRAVIIGDDEAKRGVVSLRTMATSEQIEVSLEDIRETIEKLME